MCLAPAPAILSLEIQEYHRVSVVADLHVAAILTTGDSHSANPHVFKQAALGCRSHPILERPIYSPTLLITI